MFLFLKEFGPDAEKRRWSPGGPAEYGQERLHSRVLQSDRSECGWELLYAVLFAMNGGAFRDGCARCRHASDICPEAVALPVTRCSGWRSPVEP